MSQSNRSLSSPLLRLHSTRIFPCLSSTPLLRLEKHITLCPSSEANVIYFLDVTVWGNSLVFLAACVQETRCSVFYTVSSSTWTFCLVFGLVLCYSLSDRNKEKSFHVDDKLKTLRLAAKPQRWAGARTKHWCKPSANFKLINRNSVAMVDVHWTERRRNGFSENEAPQPNNDQVQHLW